MDEEWLDGLTTRTSMRRSSHKPDAMVSILGGLGKRLAESVARLALYCRTSHALRRSAIRHESTTETRYPTTITLCGWGWWPEEMSRSSGPGK